MRNHLPYMCDHMNWALIEDMRRLPVKGSEIYRKSTL